MAVKKKVIRTVTCFTAAASLVLATVPAYGAEVPSPDAPQSPTATKNAIPDSGEPQDSSLSAADSSDEATENSSDEATENGGNDSLEIQESGPDSSTPQAAGSPVQIPYTGSTVLPGFPQPSGKGPLTNNKYTGIRFGQPRQTGNGWAKDGALMLNNFLGSGHADVLYFVKQDGDIIIRLYAGKNGGGLRTVGNIGNGWGIFDLVTAGDVNQDGKSDLIARKSNGDLYFYAGRKGTNLFRAGVKIGNGWTGMRSLTFMPRTVGNRPGVLAVDHAGRMHIYPFANRQGRFSAPVRLGYGWNSVTRVMATGDVDRNGKSDFFATDSSGFLYLYRASAAGNTFSSALVGNGWNVMSQILPIDASLGGGIMAINQSGLLYYYPIHGLASPSRRAGWRPSSRYLHPVSRVRAPGTTVVPRRGWNGTKVREVRARLGVGVPLNAGMTFDGRTENAVKRLQSRSGLRATGVVDSRTWRKLSRRSWTMDNFQMRPVGINSSRTHRLNKMLSFARSQVGSPYTWGGAGGYGDGYDCSGLALQAMYVAGIDPQPINVIAHAAPTYRSSKQLYAHPKLQKVRFGSRQPGDLVFWQGRGGIYHVAIYLGSDQIIESNYGYARQRGLYNWGSIAPYVVRPLAR